MKKYAVHGTVTISVFTEVEASSAREAKSIALQRGVMNLCHYCSSGSHARDHEEWVPNGFGDEPVEKIVSCEILDD